MDAMQDKDCSPSQQFECLQRAVNKHKEQMIQCLQGQGITRHLLGLRIIAMMSGEPMPPFFSDVGYKRSTGYVLSTSNVAGFLGGFSPFDDQGTGVCYGINQSYINFSICASTLGPLPNKQSGGGGARGGKTTASVFREELSRALMDIQQVCMLVKRGEDMKAKM